MYDIVEAYMKYKNHPLKNNKEYEKKFTDYREIDEEERNNYMNKKLGELPIQKLLQGLSLNDLLWVFDAVSLYPSAMSDEKSVYPRIETGYVFRPKMNDQLNEKFINQTFTQGSAIIKIKYYNPKHSIVQHLAVKEKEKKTEISRMRNVYIINTITSVDIQEVVKIGGKVVEIYEGVIYGENLKVSPCKKVIDKLFELRQKDNDENNDIMHL